ncbi:caspase family protein [Cyanobacterium aponinum UTEX 3222]|uniref:caspase family protein n=1 Tax=Cyanobacterium aponinum TaxID=379064 RepID=UPI002B4BF910|nr:caspase family protein [Cyanobacterium aponinum]WRL38499.1 caspase family protein [Cyanobacterium aponinum UTEX 3221]WRL42092.1 caspase family protein [Cyanobacterium aponinum UTEX 3222]
MINFSRRNFLQGVGFSLASLYMWNHQATTAYGKTLAESNTRKLALLVGINHYAHGDSLHGCVTDVELQRQLLIHRFGFFPEDIVVLTDKQATRENILTAFQEHLCLQANANDVVVFHFSGYGRQVKLFSSDDNRNLVDSLVVYDSLRSDSEFSHPFVDDILLDTLVKLAESLKTTKYTLVLDTSFIPSPLTIRNKLSLRSYDFQPNLIISEKEQDFYQKLVKSNSNSIIKNNQNKSLQGLILSPSQDSISVEINSLNFKSGLFTYNLTQSLWQEFPSTANLALMKNIASQMALYHGNKEKIDFTTDNKSDVLSYHLPLEIQNRGSAIVTKIIESNVIELELLGLPLLVLSNYCLNSCFRVDNDEQFVVVQINSLQGNKAKGIVIQGDKNLLKINTVLQEYIRVINQDTGLNIALNDTLEKIEKVDATSALSVIDNVVSISNIGETFADCILDKLTSEDGNIDGYGLYSPTGVLYPNTTPQSPHEAVSTAVKRLTKPLKTTLASKLFNLTYNQYSSTLPVNIALEITHDNISSTHSKYTFNSKLNKPHESANVHPDNLLINIPLGSQFTININNETEQNLYYLLLGINSSREAIAYFSPHSTLISPQDKISIPENASPLKWIVNAGKGIGELIIIVSKFSFENTLKNIEKMIEMKKDMEQIIILENPELVAKSILQDIHQNSDINPQLFNNYNDIYALNMNNWATFRYVYEIN